MQHLKCQFKLKHTERGQSVCLSIWQLMSCCYNFKNYNSMFLSICKVKVVNYQYLWNRCIINRYNQTMTIFSMFFKQSTFGCGAESVTKCDFNNWKAMCLSRNQVTAFSLCWSRKKVAPCFCSSRTNSHSVKKNPIEITIKINRNLFFSLISKISATYLHRWTQNSLQDCFMWL